VLGDPAGAHVATVEHLMATLFGLGIDNVAIEIDGSEVPILDGSAGHFVDAFDQAGIEQLAFAAALHSRPQAGAHRGGRSWAEFRPYDGTRFEVEIDFDSPAIGRQALANRPRRGCASAARSRGRAPSAS
jgi:UDP-3-O-[3-hydroxymyristoyl] N-acetylglucosamine deacetylase